MYTGKPIQWGFKMWCRCDSDTGYLFECDLYTGKKKTIPQQKSECLGDSVVLQLTENIVGLDCELYIDNFFNSPRLLEKLFQRNIKCCGTLRRNRKDMPNLISKRSYLVVP